MDITKAISECLDCVARMHIKSDDKEHFLHITRRKYRKQYKRLKRLYGHDEYLVDPKAIMKKRQLFKYWRKKELLFSKVKDSPIYMTDELWYSVTPEILAVFLAKFLRACLPNANKILDVFCGGGGNAIQFAKLFSQVYGVDNAIEHLFCTFKNAQTYGVGDRIWLKYGPWERISARGRFAKLGIDCIFGSPPWGGPQYLKQDVYDLELALKPMGITELLKSFAKISDNIVLFLPRNSDLHQLSRATRSVMGADAKCRILKVSVHGYVKGIYCMWGQSLVDSSKQSDSQIEVGYVDSQDDNAEEKSEAEAIKRDPVNYEIDG